jgi:CRP-like cAMP-binding protein
MTADTISVLRQHPFFVEFQPKHMEKLATLGSEVHFNQNEVIFREEEDSGLFYVILSGRVAIEAHVADRTFRIQTLYPGDDLGWSAVLQRKRHFEARALEPVKALAFEVSALRNACLGNPYFGCALMERLFRVVADRLQRTRLQLLSVLEEDNRPAAPDI